MRDDFSGRVLLEDGTEALECGVQRAAERRRGDQLDLRVVREPVAELVALVFAEICEAWVADYVVFLGEVVFALLVDGVSEGVSGWMAEVGEGRRGADGGKEVPGRGGRSG